MPSDLAELIALYYRLVPADELSSVEPAELAAAVQSHLALAAHRVPGRALVRLLNPVLAEDGWSSRDTVVQIVTDNMPYLLDSVVAELARIKVSVRRLMHPIIVVRRDLTGTLQEVLARSNPDEAPTGALVESWMHVNVDRIVDPDQVHQVEQRLLTILTDVREVVEDTQRMAGVAYALADELDTAPPPLPAEEVADGAALLRWLAGGHLTFLGYRRYELVWQPTGGPRNTGGPGNGATPGLRAVLGSGLGVLRKDSVAARGLSTGPDVEPLARNLLILTQASAPATVHRPVHPHYIGVKIFDERGAVSGEHRFLGVLATTALHEDVTRIPVINRRVLQVIRRAGVPLDSYSGQRMLEVLQSYPRAELFSADPDSLYQTVTGVLSLTQRRALRLFCRRDPYGRFFSCLVYLPRDRYTTAARLAMQNVLMRDLRGTGVEYSAQIGESVHARVHFTVRTDSGDSGVPTRPDVPAITERLEDAVRTWDDRLLDTSLTSDAVADDLVRRYLTAFPQAYKEDFDAATALADISRLETLAAADGLDLSFDLTRGAASGEGRLTLYLARRRITLSDVLPVLRQMDVEVVDERPYAVIRSDGAQCWIYDFALRLDATVLAQWLARTSRTCSGDSVTRSWPHGGAPARWTAATPWCCAPGWTGDRRRCCVATSATCAKLAAPTASTTLRTRCSPTAASPPPWSPSSRRVSTRRWMRPPGTSGTTSWLGGSPP